MPSPSILASDLMAALHWRYATKKFDPTKKIAPDLWQTLEEALVLSPSSYGLQPWKFIVVTDPELRLALKKHSWKQTQPVDCSHFVVFAVQENVDAAHADRFLARTAEVHGVAQATFNGYRKIMVDNLEKATAEGRINQWQTHQIYIALGQFMAVAAALGVDTCPMEGLVPESYDEALGLQGTGFKTVVACAAGYRAADDKYATLPKVRFVPEDVIVHR